MQNQIPTEDPRFKGGVEIFNVSVEDGRLGSVAIRTEALEFKYSYYVHDDAASLFITRRFDDYHRRTVEAYVLPDVAQRLIVAFSTGRGGDLQATWKYLFDVVDIMISNLRDVAAVRMGNERGIMFTFGYQHKSDKLYIYATAEWKTDRHSCTVHESDLVPRGEVNMLKHYLENVLALVQLCLP